MKNKLILLGTTALLATNIFASQTFVDASKLQELKKMNAVFQDPVLSIQGAIEKPDSYIVKLVAKTPRGSQNITAILNKKTSELYIGSAYDKNGKSITYPKDANIVKDGVAFTYGTGSKEIYIITDPECPYCKKFEVAAQGKLDEYKVHVILFPLSFHKKAPAMTEWILQGKDDAQRHERFEAVMLKGSTKYTKLVKDEKKPYEYSDESKKYIEKAKAAFAELDARGTPALYDAKFNSITRDDLFKSSKKDK
ncbi:Thiol:disulfide interchange protein DsbC [hydrothermal vent metagenome]|uniref:Thiol:disulfide interchange protein DsbC n=1 Tax=hydrothermal vent metagenome TaxID=652676 RepID=A0A1W1EEQ1_9ZZZZ